MKKQLNQRSVLKELRRSDFLITIEEYVGARETPLSTTKREKYKKGIKDIKT